MPGTRNLELETSFDVIVIGAGINGAGIARDAASRGLKVLLLDKGDVGGGTSSWSTRLIHGGLRYLEHGEFGLVRESLRERERLLKIAPHLVRVLPMLVPIYRNARRGVWTLRAGMLVYDLLSFDKTLPRHRMLSRDQTIEQAPAINRDGLLGAAVYFDAQVEFAERLVVENVLSAVEHGATVLTYAQVEKLLVENGRLGGIEYRSLVHDQPDTGSTGVSPAIRPSASAGFIVNAAGPWVDQLIEELGDSPRLIGGTKGSHIIVAPFTGAPKTAIYVEAKTDARPFFIIPWNGHYLIGTTDIRYDGDLNDVRIDRDEVDYLLLETNRVIPEAGLTRESILYTYSGVRPLAYRREHDEQSITRRHFIRRHPRHDNLLSIVGGKLTTYRSLAEEVVDLIYKQLKQTRRQCTTANEPLPGAASNFATLRNDFKQQCHLDEKTLDRWMRIYGVRTAAIVELIDKNAELAEVFDEETGAVAAEIVFAFQKEFAQTLADCLLRRTMVGLNSSCGLNAIEKAASIAKKYLSWSDVRAQREIDAYREEVDRRLAKVDAAVVPNR
jgi:glycerol-3-phosphate dehydrogenase